MHVMDLDLSSNSLEDIGQFAFQNISGSLLRLNLGNNALKTRGVAEECFQSDDDPKPFTLEELILTSNSLTRQNAFTVNTQLPSN